MSEEEIRKRIELIIEQQAQFTADIQILRETQAADAKLLKEKHNNLTDALTTVVGMVGKLAAAQERTDSTVAELADRVSNLAVSQERTDAKVAELADRLNVFIDVVERYISRNGKGGSEGHA